MFLKVDRALSKLITLLISNKKEFNHFFKSRSSDVLLKLGNLHQNAKRYEARNTEREARDENVRGKRADFSYLKLKILIVKGNFSFPPELSIRITLCDFCAVE